MSTTKKAVGDQVRITRGQYQNQIGTLAEKTRYAWQVELEDGERIKAAFSMVELVNESEVVVSEIEPTVDETVEQQDDVEYPIIAEDTDESIHSIADPVNELELETEDSVIVDESISAELDEPHSTTVHDREPEPVSMTELEVEVDPIEEQTELSNLTVKQLQTLVKQRGIGIARTKSDFIRIIKEKNPEEDMEQLKGKVLFDRVSELHISRLRTKPDLVRLLS